MKKFEKIMIASFIFYTLTMLVLICLLFQVLAQSRSYEKTIRELQKEPIRMEIKNIA